MPIHRLHGLVYPSDPGVSPDGSQVAFVVTTIDVEADQYRSQIWVHDPDGTRRLTSGESDESPRWSPDGRRVAFLRKDEEEEMGVPQVAVISVDGGDARVVTDFPLGVSGEPVWSPDGAWIAVTGSVWIDEWAGAGADERKRMPRRITRRTYRADGRGWVNDRRRYVYLVDPDGGSEPRRLTDGSEDESSPAWSPDGSKVAYLSDASPTPGYQPGASILEASIGGPRVDSPAPWGMWWAVGYRPDGVLHAIGHPGTDFPDHPLLWRFDPGPVCVNEGHPRAVFSPTVGSTRLAFRGDEAVVSNIDSGSVGVISVDPEGKVDDLVAERGVVTGFDVAGGTLAAVLSTVESPGVVVVDTDEGRQIIDDLGGPTVEAIVPDHFVVDGPGGPLDVWVYLPAGEETVPLLLNIHGGPSSQYGWGYFDEFQVYASEGYGVVATNPRGSAGKDRDFLRAVAGEGWGVVDVEDVDAAVEAALSRHPRLDPDRLGVMGGSYGGFLTAWIIAHQDGWSAAVVERALLSWPSFGGTSDIGGWFGDAYLGDPGLMWDRSPLRVAPRVQTPTLIIHSEEDYRCPIEQAEQYFDALLRNGVTAEFVRFPGEGHELSRSGRPRHREERFEAILDWLARWLT